MRHIISLVTVFIIFGLSMVTLWKLSPTWVEKDEKFDWGMTSIYSLLFGLLGGSVILIIGLQRNLKRRKNKELALYK